MPIQPGEPGEPLLSAPFPILKDLLIETPATHVILTLPSIRKVAQLAPTQANPAICFVRVLTTTMNHPCSLSEGLIYQPLNSDLKAINLANYKNNPNSHSKEGA